jgi:hypothetical protein
MTSTVDGTTFKKLGNSRLSNCAKYTFGGGSTFEERGAPKERNPFGVKEVGNPKRPAPTAYTTQASIDPKKKQTESKRRTAPSFGFGPGFGTLSHWEQQQQKGKSKSWLEQREKYGGDHGGQGSDHRPGPSSYSQKSSVEKQPESHRTTEPKFSFGGGRLMGDLDNWEKKMASGDKFAETTQKFGPEGGTTPGPTSYSVMEGETSLPGDRPTSHQTLPGSTMGRNQTVGLKNAPHLHSAPGYTFSGSYQGVADDTPNKPREQTKHQGKLKSTSSANPDDWMKGRHSMGKQTLSTQHKASSFTMRGNTGAEERFVGAGQKKQPEKLLQLRQKTLEGTPQPADTARPILPKGVSGEEAITSSTFGKQVLSSKTSRGGSSFGGGKAFNG